MRDTRGVAGLYYSPAWLWWMLPPMLAVILVLLALNLIGTAVEQRINPRLARHTARDVAR